MVSKHSYKLLTYKNNLVRVSKADP